jgi:hypothetical protein
MENDHSWLTKDESSGEVIKAEPVIGGYQNKDISRTKNFNCDSTIVKWKRCSISAITIFLPIPKARNPYLCT